MTILTILMNIAEALVFKLKIIILNLDSTRMELL